MLYKDIFLKVINNKIIHQVIFKYIKYIHKSVFKERVYKWNQLLDRPELMIQYNYKDQLELYFKSKSTRLYSDDAISLSRNTIIFGRYEILVFILEQLVADNKHWFSQYYHSESKDLMWHAAKFGSFQLINYLEQFRVMAECSTNYIKYYTNDNNNKSSFFNYQQALIISLRSGNMEIVKWFIQKASLKQLIDNRLSFNKACIYSARSGNLEIFDWLIDYYNNSNSDSSSNRISNILYKSTKRKIWTGAIKSRNINLLNYLYNSRIFSKSFREYHLLDVAIEKYTNTDIMYWLLSKNVKYDIHRLMCNVIIFGEIHTVKWLYQQLPSSICNPNQLNLFDWFYRNSLNNNSNTINSNSETITTIEMEEENEVEEIDIDLYEDEIYSIDNIIDYSAQFNRFDFIEWICKERPNETGTHISIMYAAQNRNYDLLEWFTIRNRAEETLTESYVKSLIMYGGNDEMTKWILTNRPQDRYSFDILDHFLSIPQVGMAQWFILNHNGSPSEISLDTAIKHNSLEICKFIHENYPHNHQLPQYHNSQPILLTLVGFQHALQVNNTALLDWIYRNRSERFSRVLSNKDFNPLNQAMRKLIIDNQPEILPIDILDFYENDFTTFKYLVDNHPRFIKDSTIVTASKFGLLDLVKQIHSNINNRNSKSIMKLYIDSGYNAIHYKQPHIIQYLKENNLIPEISFDEEDDDDISNNCLFD